MQNLDAIRAVFFDFDGTLIDSYPAIAASVNYLRSQHNLSPLQVDEVRRFVGHGPIYLLEHTVPGGDPEKCLKLYREHHPAVMFSGTELLPGAEELLALLQDAGKKVGLCSNKPRVFSEELLAHFHWRDKFDVVLGPEDVAHVKPAPDMLIEGMRRLQIEAVEALYIGDMSVDIQTARGAGVNVWVVPTGSETEQMLQSAQPDRLLHDLYDVVSLLR